VIRVSQIETASPHTLGQLFIKKARDRLFLHSCAKDPVLAMALLEEGDVPKQYLWVAPGEPKRVLNRRDS
jgi:hypothetical protein